MVIRLALVSEEHLVIIFLYLQPHEGHHTKLLTAHDSVRDTHQLDSPLVKAIFSLSLIMSIYHVVVCAFWVPSMFAVSSVLAHKGIVGLYYSIGFFLSKSIPAIYCSVTMIPCRA